MCTMWDVYYQLLEIIWNFFGILMDPNYDVVWSFVIFKPLLHIIVIIVDLIKNNC
jgi:hypothetical protein